jgi:hypothetical protein
MILTFLKDLDPSVGISYPEKSVASVTSRLETHLEEVFDVTVIPGPSSNVADVRAVRGSSS